MLKPPHYAAPALPAGIDTDVSISLTYVTPGSRTETHCRSNPHAIMHAGLRIYNQLPTIFNTFWTLKSIIAQPMLTTARVSRTWTSRDYFSATTYVTRQLWIEQNLWLAKNTAPITTKCQNLVNLAYKLHYSCQISNYYTFGIVGGTIQNGSDQVGYYLRIAGEAPWSERQGTFQMEQLSKGKRAETLIQYKASADIIVHPRKFLKWYARCLVVRKEAEDCLERLVVASS